MGNTSSNPVERARYENYRARWDRIRTIEMLLDAQWMASHEVFVKITRTTHANGLASHWETFYNELGEEVPRPKGYQSA